MVSERDRLAYQVRLIDSCSIRHILNIYLITATVTYHYFDHLLTGMQIYPTSSSNLSLTQKVNKKYSVRKIPSNNFLTCASSLTSSAKITGAVESSQRIGRPLRCRVSLNRSKKEGEYLPRNLVAEYRQQTFQKGYVCFSLQTLCCHRKRWDMSNMLKLLEDVHRALDRSPHVEVLAIYVHF